MDAAEKRAKFFADNPIVYNQYLDIKEVNSVKGIDITTARLRKIKEYAIAHTDFYSGYSPDDDFPVMKKQDYINDYGRIRSNECFDLPIHITSTSGSTGTPFKVEQDYCKRCRTIADLKVYGEYADYPSREKMLQLRAYNGITLDRKVDEENNIWRYDVYNLNDGNVEELLDFIRRWRPKIIFGYTSTMETICNYVLRNGIDCNFECGSVLVGAEMLTDEIAEKIKSVFKCPLFDRYSNMEMGILAQREYGVSNFKINKASYYFEVLKLDEDSPAEEHEVGRLVFTDLYNRAFPMIRYDTGDLGSFARNSAGEIEIETIFGRKLDCLYDSKGVMVSPHCISHGMWGIKNIQQWQFVQKADNEYAVRICSNGDVDEPDVLNRLYNVLGYDANIHIEYVKEIPIAKSYKRKYIINEWKK